MATATARARKSETTKVLAALTPPKVGDTIDQLYDLREKKRALEVQIAEIESEYHALEEVLLARMDEEQIAKSTGTKASASITMSTVASIVDRAAFDAFVKKTGHFQLFQNRVSDPSFRELLESRKGKAIPGLESFNKRRLNLRSL